MAKQYSKRTIKRTKIRLSPKEANDILRQEFTDSRKNKHIFKIQFKPQNPLEPDYKQTIQYKDNK